MKISLITYHISSNYGAIMQTYSLCRYLENIGKEVEIIDIRQSEETIGLIPKLIKPIVFFFRMNRIIKKMYPPLSKRYTNLDDLQKNPPIADVYMVGSDQVWNPNISKSLQMAYFLKFGNLNVKRVSYASSFGLSEWPDSLDVDQITECLNSFDSLSVREEQGKIICEQVFGCTPEVVSDPTFLLDNYDDLVDRKKERNEIVCYKLQKNQDFFDNIGYVGEKLGLPIALLNHNYKVRGLKYCPPLSLKQWLQRLSSAKFIVTDSFHGIAFSLIFNKQFIVIRKDDGKDSRLINILKSIGLEDRMYDSVERLKRSDDWLRTQIDYSVVNNRIQALRSKSREFLTKALN